MDLILLVLPYGLAALSLIWVFGVLAGSDRSEVRSDGARVLRYSRYFRGGAIMCMVLIPVGLQIGGLTGWVGRDDRLRASAVAAVCVGVGGLMMFVMEGTRVVLTQEGIEKRTWYRKPQFFLWADVSRVYRGWLEDWVVRHKDGRRIRVHEGMTPFEWFSQACREHLPPGSYPEKWW